MTSRSTFVIMTYDDEDQATQALHRLKDAEKREVLEIEDAVVVRKDPDGKVHVTETKDMTAGRGAAIGGVIGLVVGAVLGGPVGALVVGGAAGALVGKAVDLGIPRDRIEIVSQAMQGGDSAIFAKIKMENMDLLRAAIRESPGHLVEFSVTNEDEEDVEQFMSAWVANTGQ